MKLEIHPKTPALGFVLATLLTAALLSGGCTSNNESAKSSPEEVNVFAGDASKMPPEVLRQSEAASKMPPEVRPQSEAASKKGP